MNRCPYYGLPVTPESRKLRDEAERCRESAYIVDDVDYRIEYATDMVAGEGDFAGDPQPNELSEDAHDFEGELDYLAGVKDICGGLR